MLGGPYTEYSLVGICRRKQQQLLNLTGAQSTRRQRGKLWGHPTGPFPPIAPYFFVTLHRQWPCQPYWRASMPQHYRGWRFPPHICSLMLSGQNGSESYLPTVNQLDYRLRCESLSSNFKKLELLFFSESGKERFKETAHRVEGLAWARQRENQS